MDRVPKANVTTTDEGTFSAGDLNRGRGQGERPRDPWRMMSELLAAERVATKSVPPPVQIASFEC